MATRNITINYPDGAATKITTVLKANYNVATNAEAFAAFEQEVKDRLKAIVFMYERKVAAKAAEGAVTETPVT